MSSYPQLNITSSYPLILRLLNLKTTILAISTAQKMQFFIEDFFSKCDQICSFLRIWSHLLKKYLMENFIFYAVIITEFDVKVTRGLQCVATSIEISIEKAIEKYKNHPSIER